MRPLLIPELKVFFQALMKLPAIIVLVQENMFILGYSGDTDPPFWAYCPPLRTGVVKRRT
jgi:hypothetical protein